MKTDNAGSASRTDTTSSNVPPPNAAASRLSDAEFLAQQASAAREAVVRALKESGLDLAHGANPMAWAKQYPWLAVGAGAVTGFVATTLLVPSKEQQALKKLAAIERALKPAPTPNGDGHKKEKDKDAGHSLVGIIAREMVKVLGPALGGILSAGISALGQQSAQGPDNAAQGDAAMPPS